MKNQRKRDAIAKRNARMVSDKLKASGVTACWAHRHIGQRLDDPYWISYRQFYRQLKDKKMPSMVRYTTLGVLKGGQNGEA